MRELRVTEDRLDDLADLHPAGAADLHAYAYRYELADDARRGERLGALPDLDGQQEFLHVDALADPVDSPDDCKLRGSKRLRDSLPQPRFARGPDRRARDPDDVARCV